MLDLGADGREHAAEHEHLAVLVLVAHRAPAWVISVLLAAFGVAANRLQMAARVAANPYVGIGGGYREFADALQHRFVGDHRAIDIVILESVFHTHSCDSGLLVRNIPQFRRTSGFYGIENGARWFESDVVRHVVCNTG